MMKKRVILWWMLLSGIVVHMLYTTNTNVAIVSMVAFATPNEGVNVAGLCRTHELQEAGRIAENASSDSSATLKRESDVAFATTEPPFRHRYPLKLEWSVREQNTVVGGFLWLAWISQFLGGLLSHKYGSKLVFGASNLIACTLSSLVPLAAVTDVKLVVAIRVAQGFIGSLGLPAGMFSMIGQWAPPDEIGKFTSVLLGTPVAICIGYPTFGFIAENFGWIWVFHSTTILGFVWIILWYYLCYDTPDQHPTITEKEKNYIKKSLSDSVSKEKCSIPWKKILTSIPFLICVAANFSFVLGLVVFNTYLPMYLKVMHGLKSTQIGVYIGATFFTRILVQLIGAFLTDRIIRRGCDVTVVRKWATAAGSVIPGMILCSILHTNCNMWLAIGSISLFVIMTALTVSGAQAAVMNISPNFSGITQGINYTIAITSGFITSILFDYFQRNYSTGDMWRYLIFVTACANCITGLLFVLFGSSELQSWNTAKIRKSEVKGLVPRN